MSNVFEINVLCSSSLHLFDQKTSSIQQVCVKKRRSDSKDLFIKMYI